MKSTRCRCIKGRRRSVCSWWPDAGVGVPTAGIGVPMAFVWLRPASRGVGRPHRHVGHGLAGRPLPVLELSGLGGRPHTSPGSTELLGPTCQGEG